MRFMDLFKSKRKVINDLLEQFRTIAAAVNLETQLKDKGLDVVATFDY